MPCEQNNVFFLVVFTAVLRSYAPDITFILYVCLHIVCHHSECEILLAAAANIGPNFLINVLVAEHEKCGLPLTGELLGVIPFTDGTQIKM